MVGDSYLHWIEALSCQSDLLLQEVCSLLGPRSSVFYMTAKIHLSFRVLPFTDCLQGIYDATKRNLEQIKRDCEALKTKVKDVRPQVVLSSASRVKGKTCVGIDASCKLTSGGVAGVAQGALAFVTIFPFSKNGRWGPCEKMRLNRT